MAFFKRSVGLAICLMVVLASASDAQSDYQYVTVDSPQTDSSELDYGRRLRSSSRSSSYSSKSSYSSRSYSSYSYTSYGSYGYYGGYYSYGSYGYYGGYGSYGYYSYGSYGYYNYGSSQPDLCNKYII